MTMKKFLFVCTIVLAFSACKNSEECQPEAVNEADLQTFNGEFIYTNEAAVLKGSQFIYGVSLDCMAEKLAGQIDPVKRDEFDMVPVVVKGIVSKNEGEGWDEKVTIYEIVSVSDTPAEADVKIEDKD